MRLVREGDVKKWQGKEVLSFKVAYPPPVPRALHWCAYAGHSETIGKQERQINIEQGI
jgi:hypothetical protein